MQRAGDMEPRAFVCKGCSCRVQEAKHGSGFEKCGVIIADCQYHLCRRCLSIVMEFLESYERGSFEAFAKELIRELGGRGGE